MIIACTSTITSVEVYARGAIVTRQVALPSDGLPAEGCELVVSGLTPQAEPTSLRAEVAGKRALVGLRSRVALPTAPPRPEGLEAEREALERQIALVARDHQRLASRLQSLDEIEPARRPRRDSDPAVRANEMLAAARLIRELEDSLDAKLVDRDAELARLVEERDRLDALLARHDPSARPGSESATREVIVRLEPGYASVDGVTIRYVVAAARWWPAYTARLAEAGGDAELSLDAFVVQASGEPWDGVRLALSTAELVADARLPKLPSLRFGRRQAPPRTGYRAPPEGLDDLFAGYDGCAASAPPPPSKPRPARHEAARDAKLASGLEGYDDDDDDDDDYAMPVEILGAMACDEVESFAEPEPEVRKMCKSGRADRAKRSLGYMTASMAPTPAPKSIAFGAGGGGPGGLPPMEPSPTGPSALEPTDAWLDFDSLVLGETHDRLRRGRLIRDAGHDVTAYRARGLHTVEGAEAPRFARDPHDARGRFDHRFAAEGLADVPSGDVLQRIGLSSAKAPCKQRLVAVPVEDDSVYREAELSNPFDGPLLGGPVDVFVGASLLTTTSLQKVGRGGKVQFGLGVEERVRIARNARVDESTSGFLSGTTEVEHRVSLEIRSSLPTATEVVLIDRVPISADDEVEVELVESTPPAERYRQTDRDSVVQGGLRWTLALPAGGEKAVSFVYRLSLPAKREVVGGNRRD